MIKSDCGRCGGNCQCTSIEECYVNNTNMKDQAPELLPCPFCGEKPDQHGNSIQCSNYECRAICGVPSNENAANIWNTRPPSERPEAAVAWRYRKKGNPTWTFASECPDWAPLSPEIEFQPLYAIQHEEPDIKKD